MVVLIRDTLNVHVETRALPSGYADDKSSIVAALVRPGCVNSAK